MCGRFGFVIPRVQAVEYFQLVDGDYGPWRNLAPTMDIPGIVQTCAGRVLRRFHWGLVPFWAKDRKMAAKLINARSEIVAEKLAFRAAFKKRRCLIPATCFTRVAEAGRQTQASVCLEHGRRRALCNGRAVGGLGRS